MIDKDLHQYLKQEAGITAVFGTRIYHEWMPQGNDTWPVLVFQKIGHNEVSPDMTTETVMDGKMDSAVYQFDVYGTGSQQVNEAADTFDRIFRVFRGTMGATKVQGIDLSNISSLGTKVGDKARRRVTMDYQLSFDV